MPISQRSPIEFDLSPDQLSEVAQDLANEVNNAIMARSSIVGFDQDLDQWQLLYEGGDRKLTRQLPWEGAANLTSYLGTQYVDATRSRIMKTVFVEPIWIVEGWGQAAIKAPFVEEFHQWKAEEERLQGFIGRAIHNALIEGTGVLEVSEKPVYRKVRQLVRSQVQTQTGMPVLGAEGEPTPLTDASGHPVPSLSGAEPHAVVQTDKVIVSRRGPRYRVLTLRDFFFLPGHVSEREDVWGYAKRVYRSIADLQELERNGFYTNVKDLSTAGERLQTSEQLRMGQQIVPEFGPTAEKELFEISYLDDLDGDGIREWIIATIHVPTRVLLRLQYDDLNCPRYMIFTPFPRGNSVYGLSLVQKLETLIHEHTALRNMIADRLAMKTSEPILKTQGSLWDEYEQPLGPGQVLVVRDINEIKQLQFADVPGSMIERERTVLGSAERIIGLNDITSGVNPAQDRTLGENQLVTTQSLIRVDEIVHNLQETMEDLFQLRHQIWKRTLADMPQLVPNAVLAAIEERGFVVPGNTATAQLLDGAFRGKPRGSTETADPGRLRGDFNAFLIAVNQLAQTVPAIRAHLSRPEVMRSLLVQAVRVYHWYDRAAFLGPTGGVPSLSDFGFSSPGAPVLPNQPGAPPASSPGGNGQVQSGGGVPDEVSSMIQRLLGRQGAQGFIQ